MLEHGYFLAEWYHNFLSFFQEEFYVLQEFIIVWIYFFTHFSILPT